MPLIPSTEAHNNIIPLIEEEEKKLNDKNTSRLAKQVEVATEGAEEVSKESTVAAAKTGDYESARYNIESMDVIERERLRNQKLQEVIANPELDADILALSLKEMGLVVPNPAALEERVINRLAPSPEAVRVAGEPLSIREQIIEDAFNAMLSNNVLAELQKEQDDEGVIKDTLDFFGHVVSKEQLLDRSAESKWDLRQKWAVIQTLPREQRRGALKALVDGMGETQFGWENPAYKLSVLDLVVNGTEADDFLDTVNVLGFVTLGAYDIAQLAKFGIKGIARSVDKHKLLPSTVADSTTEAMVKAAEAAGNKQVIAKEATKPVDESKVFVTEEDQVGAVLPIKPEGTGNITLSADIEKQLRVNGETLDEATFSFLEAEYASEIAQRAIQMEVRKPVREFIDMDVALDGSIKVKFGDINANSFATKEMADDYIKQLLPRDPTRLSAVELPSGEWAVQAKLHAEELDSAADVLGTSRIRNTSDIIDQTLVSASRLAESANNRQMYAAGRVVQKSLNKYLGHIRPRQAKINRDVFNQVSNEFMKKGRWATDIEFATRYEALRGKPANQGIIAAYRTQQQLDRMAYHLDNSTVYRSELSQGYNSYLSRDFTKGELDYINAKPAELSSVVKQDGSLSQATTIIEEGGVKGRHRTVSPGELDKAGIDNLLTTHELIRVSERSINDLATSLETVSARYAFIPKGSKNTRLHYKQIPEKAGGRGGYAHSAFIKAARTVTHADGSVVRIHDKTLAAADSVPQAQRYVDRMNEAVKVYSDYKAGTLSLESANAAIRGIGLFDGAVSFQTVDDVGKWGLESGLMKEGLPVDIKLQAVRDGDAVDLGTTQFADNFADGVHSVYQGRSFLKHRSNEILPHVDGLAADILDPVQAIVSNLERASRMNAWAPFKRRALDFLRLKYGHELPDVSDVELLGAAPLKGSKHHDEILNHQQWLRDIIGYKTEYQRSFQAKVAKALDKTFEKIPALENAANYLGATMNRFWLGKDLAKGKRVNVRAALVKAAEADPYVRAKSAVFNMKLGLGNPASFIMQFSHTVVISGITGTHGLKAGGQGLFGRIALNMDKEALKAFADKTATKIGFDSPEDFIEYVSEFKQLGFGYLGKNIAYIDGVAGANISHSLTSSIADKGRFFFDEGEKAARLTAYGAARSEWLSNAKNINPQKQGASTAAGRKYISDRTHALMLGMTKSDLQLALRAREGEGLASNIIPLMTQFWSYPMRAIGALAGRELTKMEKIRYVTTNFIAFGSAGVPLVNVLNDWLDNKYGDKIDPTTAKFLASGIFDAAMLEATGADTAFGKRAGSGHFLSEVYKNMTEGAFADVIFGATGSTGHGGLDAFVDAYRLTYAHKDNRAVAITDGLLAVLQDQISSVSRTSKYIHAMATGEVLSRDKKKYFDVTEMEATLNFIGIPYDHYNNVSKTYLSEKARNQKVKDATKDLLSYHIKMEQALEDNDKEKVKYYQDGLTLVAQYWRKEFPALWSSIERSLANEINSQSLLQRKLNQMLKLSNLSGDTEGTLLPKGTLYREQQKRSNIEQIKKEER